MEQLEFVSLRVHVIFLSLLDSSFPQSSRGDNASSRIHGFTERHISLGVLVFVGRSVTVLATRAALGRQGHSSKVASAVPCLSLLQSGIFIGI